MDTARPGNCGLAIFDYGDEAETVILIVGTIETDPPGWLNGEQVQRVRLSRDGHHWALRLASRELPDGVLPENHHSALASSMPVHSPSV